MGQWWSCSGRKTKDPFWGGIWNPICDILTAISGYIINALLIVLIGYMLFDLAIGILGFQLESGIISGFTALSSKAGVAQILPIWFGLFVALIFLAFIVSVVSMIIWGGDQNFNGFLNITASNYGWMFFAFFVGNAFLLAASLGYIQWRSEAFALIYQQEEAVRLDENEQEEQRQANLELASKNGSTGAPTVVVNNQSSNIGEKIYRGTLPKWAVYLVSIVIALVLVAAFSVDVRLWIIIAHAGLKQGISGFTWRDFIPFMLFHSNSEIPTKYANFCYDMLNINLTKNSQGQPLTLGYILCLTEASNNFLNTAFNTPFLVGKFFDELCNFIEPYFLLEDVYVMYKDVALSGEKGFDQFKSNAITNASDIGNLQIGGMKYYLIQHLPAAFCSSLSINYLAIRSLMLQDLGFGTIDQNNAIVLKNLGYITDSVIVNRLSLGTNFVQIPGLSRLSINPRNTKLYIVVNQILGAHILQIMHQVPIRSEYISLLQSYNISPSDPYLIGLQYRNNVVGELWMLQKNTIVLNPVRYVYDPTIPSALSYYDNVVQELEVSFDPNSPTNRAMDVQSQIFNLLLGGSFTTLSANNRQKAINGLYVRNVLSAEFQNLFDSTAQFSSLMNQIGSTISSNLVWASSGHSGQPTLNAAYHDYIATNFNPLAAQTSTYGTSQSTGPSSLQVNALANALITNYATLAQNVGSSQYSFSYGPNNATVSLNITVDLLNVINASRGGTVNAALTSYVTSILTANTYITSLTSIGQSIIQEAVYKPALCLSSLQNPGVTLISPSGANSWLPAGNNPVTGSSYSQNFLYRDFILLYGASGGDLNAITKLIVRMLQNLADPGKYKIIKDTVRQTLSYGKTLQYLIQNPYVYSSFNLATFQNNYGGYYLFDQLNNCYINLSRMMSNYSNVQFAFRVINYTGALDANAAARQSVLDQTDMYIIKLIADIIWYYVWQCTAQYISYSSVTDVNSFWVNVYNYQTTWFIPGLSAIIQGIINTGQMYTFNSGTGLFNWTPIQLGSNFNFISQTNLNTKIAAIASNYFHDFMVGSMLAQCGFSSANNTSVLSSTCFVNSTVPSYLATNPFSFIDIKKTKVMVIPNDNFQVQFLNTNGVISPAPTAAAPIPIIYANSPAQLINL